MPKINAVIPLLVYRNIPAGHEFLVKAFGFEPGGVVRAPNGEAIHGEVQAGPTTIWLHQASSEHALDSRQITNSGLVVLVDDVDAHCKRAREAGAHIDSEPRDQPYGQREYGARDPEGHHWWFATRLSPANH